MGSKNANLEASLRTGGPYTIFAPNNAAFSKLSPGKLDSLMKDNGRFATLLKSHMVTGRYGKADIIKALTAGKGKATLTTLNGQPLQLSISPTKKLQLTTADGVTAEVVLYDLLGNNGIVNGIDAILLPGNAPAAAPPKS
ncbi:fasciclin domain-containing protein [Mucilaginibacter sp. S1162]|uniref:Fasciclin domain-containing protein n=1 Tax=Mucilaginibacter humi TaxID=2732510 RepID=A0ABX1W3M3_9SPHI|nr:fasciclin domain-containing protein [Mucilaginibacter humi]